MEKHYETPETNVRLAALNLMRFKALSEIGKDGKASDWVLTMQDVNEILTVAGLPVLVPADLHKKDLDVVEFSVNKEDVE